MVVLLSGYHFLNEWSSAFITQEILDSTLSTWVRVEPILRGDLDVIVHFWPSSWCLQVFILCRSVGWGWDFLALRQ